MSFVILALIDIKTMILLATIIVNLVNLYVYLACLLVPQHSVSVRMIINGSLHKAGDGFFPFKVDHARLKN